MIRKLYTNPWVELRELVLPEKGVDGYVYLHEKRCGGDIVALLPYKTDPEGNLVEVMVSTEVTPCWSMDEAMSAITGGVEKKDGKQDIVGTAVMELREEGGLKAPAEALRKLGTCRGTKSSDTVYHLFAVDASEAEEVEAEGDGSYLESLAKCIWIKPSEVRNAEDPLLPMLFMRLVFG